MKKVFWALVVLAVFALGAYLGFYFRGRRLSWNDVVTYKAAPGPVGVRPGDPLIPLGLTLADLDASGAGQKVRFLRKSTYLDGARAVVTHTIDDSSEFVKTCLDTMDKYGIKATVFVSTQVAPISTLWPRLKEAVANGHEIGSHSRRHQCQWPDTWLFCLAAYTDYEVRGSRDDILANTPQPYVWAWCYPCGNCAERAFVRRKLARAGYLVARPYPGEAEDRHILPNLQTYDSDPYYARYTQVVQKKGGIARSGRTDVADLNAKFDEVYRRGGIYNFLSHPQWLDYGPDSFYERHLAHVGKRRDVWYVPMGLLYAYRAVREQTQVRPLAARDAVARYAVYNTLDENVYPNSLTLEFTLAEGTGKVNILARGKPLPERAEGVTDRWDAENYRRDGRTIYVTLRPGTILEFR